MQMHSRKALFQKHHRYGIAEAEAQVSPVSAGSPSLDLKRSKLQTCVDTNMPQLLSFELHQDESPKFEKGSVDSRMSDDVLLHVRALFPQPSGTGSTGGFFQCKGFRLT